MSIKRNKLAICFQTANRARHIEEYLNIIIEDTLKMGVTIYIFDGSDSNNTEEVIKKYTSIEKYNNIVYNRYENSLERNKAIFFLPNEEYIWLMGDKYIVSPKHYSLFLSYIDKGYDILTFYNKGLESKEYENANELFRDCAWFMTHHGSTIIKKSLVCEVYIDYIKSADIAFLFSMLYFEAMNPISIKGVFLNIEDLNLVSKYTTISGALTSPEKFWSVWAVNWPNAVMALPEYYNEYKQEVILSHDYWVGFFRRVLNARGQNRLNLKAFLKYRKQIKIVTKTKPIIFFLVSLMPKRVCSKLFYLKGGR